MASTRTVMSMWRSDGTEPDFERPAAAPAADALARNRPGDPPGAYREPCSCKKLILSIGCLCARRGNGRVRAGVWRAFTGLNYSGRKRKHHF
jgi:hypothetical protein